MRSVHRYSRRDLFARRRRAVEVQAMTSAMPLTGNPKLIVCFLRGGLDMFSLIAPYDSADYQQHRTLPGLRMNASNSTDLGLQVNGHRFAVPNTCMKLAQVFAADDLTFVVNTGAPHANKSHFAMQRWMETGTTTAMAKDDGIFARLLERTGTTVDSPRAFTFGTRRPLSLRSSEQTGDVQKVVTARDPRALVFPGPGGAIGIQYENGVRDAYAASQDVELSETAASMFRSFDYIEALKIDTLPTGVMIPDGTFPDTPLGDAMRDIAIMCLKPVGNWCPDTFHVDVGGFDTHSNQDIFSVADGDLGKTLADLSHAMHGLHYMLTQHPTDFVCLTMSEFGRRARENGSGGTDHGDGGVMMVMGQSVKGGVGGSLKGSYTYPNLTLPGDLERTSDYREVLAEMFEKKFSGIDVNYVLNGVGTDRHDVFE